MGNVIARFVTVIFCFMFAISLVPAPALAAGASGVASSGGMEKIADPDTSGTWRSLFEPQSSGASEDVYSTQDSGRIWVDKSVYADESSAQAAGIPDVSMVDADNDFLVGLSTMSAASTVQRESRYSHDVVFVVSLNTAMASLQYDGRPYAAHLADALNESIGRLMEQNDGTTGGQAKTRVAVIGYSVDVTVLMPLDSYRPNADGSYIEFSQDLEGGAGFKPVCTPDSSGVVVRSEVVRGNSYLQRALSEASSIFAQAAQDSTADSPRKPELVVMGAQVSLMANTNVENPPEYAEENPGENGFVGSMPSNRNEVGFGTDAALATLLTEQYMRNTVDSAYAASGGGELGVRTVGLDTSYMGAYVLQTRQQQASADITETVGTSTVDLVQNMEEARCLYAEAAEAKETSVELRLYSPGVGGIKRQDITFANPVDGLLSPDDGYAFDGADEYFFATDAGALPGGFGAAVDRILGIEYNSPVNAGEGSASDSSDRFRVQDDIGHLMNVKRVDGILFDGKLLDGSKAAQAVTVSFSDPWDVEAYHEVSYIMQSLNTRYDLGWDAYNLLYEAYADGQFAYRGAGDYSNFVSWYVNGEHEMVKTGTAGYTFAPSDAVAAAETGDWEKAASPDVKAGIQAAQRAGATAICQTYFYIGNIESQYTGDDVPLYDFVVMVETSLETGDQKLLLTIPAESIPARKAYVTEHLDGTVTMSLDKDAESVYPLRLVYEVGPRAAVISLAGRIEAGEDVSEDEIEQVLGMDTPTDASGGRLLYVGAFEGEGDAITPDSVMSAVTASTNGYYSFTRDTPLFVLGEGESLQDGELPSRDQLTPLKSMPQPGQTCYYPDTYYQASSLQAGKESEAEAITVYQSYEVPDGEGETARFEANGEGEYHIVAGTPKYRVSAMLDDYAKNPNATETAPYTKRLSVSDYSALGRPMLSARLGNNGTYILATNQEKGSVVVEKHLASGGEQSPLTEADRERAFSFSAKFSNAEGAPLTGPVSIEGPGDEPSRMVDLDDEGSMTFQLADGQSVAVEGLPAGARYTVEEVLDGASENLFTPSYTVTSGGAESAPAAGGQTAELAVSAGSTTVSFTNTKESGSLVLTKETKGNAADQNKSFPFRVVLTDVSGTPLPGTFAYGLFSGTDVSNWDSWSTGVATSGEDGVVKLEDGSLPSLAAGQSIALAGIPIGTSYDVSEGDNDGYTVTVAGKTAGGDASNTGSQGKGSISNADQIDVLTFTNELWAYGELKLTKNVSGTSGEAAGPFKFVIEFEDAQGAPLTGDISYSVEGDDASQETRSLENGKLTVELYDGQTAVVGELLQGTRYRIVEIDPGDEYLTVRDGDEGVIGEEPAEASFLNIRQTGALGIAKTVVGNSANRDMKCSFMVTVEGIFAGEAPEVVEKKLKATYYRGTGQSEEAEVVFSRTGNSDEGIAEVDDVGHGEGVLIEGLSSTAKFSVEEVGAAGLKDDGYVISSGIGGELHEASKVEGTLSPDAVTGVFFENARNEYGNLKICKEIQGNAALDEAQQGRSFTFTVVAENADGSPVVGSFELDGGDSDTVVFENGRAQVSLSAPKTTGTSTSVVIRDLPANAKCTVSEQDMSASGYEVESTGTEQVVKGGETVAACFTNSKSYAPLSMPITGLEVLNNRMEQAGDFVFELYDESGTEPVLDAQGEPITATSKASEAGVPTSFVLKGLSISEPGVHTFVVKQREGASGPIAGVTYDDRTFTVKVDVKANVKGKLSLSALSYEVGGKPTYGIYFVNEYRSSTGVFSLAVKKSLSGASLSEGGFSFQVQEVDPQSGTPLGAPLVAHNGADGSVVFPSLAASGAAGENVSRTFVVSESLPPEATQDNGYTAGGIVYDTVQYRVVVTGSDPDGDGTLSFSSEVSERTIEASGEYGNWRAVEGVGALDGDENVPAFSNSYDDKTAVVSGPTVKKQLEGRDWSQEDSFTFVLQPESATAPDGSSLELSQPVALTIDGFDAARQGTAASGESAVKAFGDLSFSKPGTYVYTLSEQVPGQGALQGMSYSKASYTFTVTVTSNGEGYLDAKSSLEARTDDEGVSVGSSPISVSEASFRNVFSADDDPGEPGGGGTGEGQDDTPGAGSTSPLWPLPDSSPTSTGDSPGVPVLVFGGLCVLCLVVAIVAAWARRRR